MHLLPSRGLLTSSTRVSAEPDRVELPNIASLLGYQQLNMLQGALNGILHASRATSRMSSEFGATVWPHPTRRRMCSQQPDTAEGQRGYFITHQAHEACVSDRLLSHWAATGVYRRVAHGIYRLRDFPAPPREELIIPLLWAGPESALSHETALELYDLANVLPATTHLTVARRFAPRRHVGITLHLAPLPAAEVVLRDDLRLTTVERTLVDCFHWGTDRGHLMLAAQHAIDRGLVTADHLQAASKHAGIGDPFAPSPVSDVAG